MQGRWRMSESKYNHNDELDNRLVVLLSLRYQQVRDDFAPKLGKLFRQLRSVHIQFQKYIHKHNMLSQGVLWSLRTDNRIKSKIS